MESRQKILDLEAAGRVIAASSPNGRRLVVARGWFDVLRGEHCRCLLEAKGDDARLVVAVHADGESHPTLLDATSRAQLVGALQVVDHVVICDETELDRLLALWRPAALIDAEGPAADNLIDHVLRRYRSS